MKRNFRIGQRVKYRHMITGKWLIVKLVARDVCLPKLWFKCSDGFLKRITQLQPLTKRERGRIEKGE